MKKFKFSLQSVFDYVKTVEKNQKADLSRAQAILRKLYDDLTELEEAYERNTRSQAAALKRGINISEELIKHDAYFRFLRDAKAELLIKIAKAEEERDKCQERLIATMKQIKIYTKLRDEQYQNYLKEVSREEEKDMNDLISFNIIAEESGMSIDNKA